MIVGLAFAAVAAWVAWRADRHVGAYLAWRTAPPPLPEPAPVLPDDLVAFALQQTERWAQDELREQLEQKYLALRDWNAVRRAFGLGVAA